MIKTPSINIRNGSRSIARRIVGSRSAILGDSPAQLYYSDVGLSPSPVVAGTPNVSWQDQSGNARHLAFASGKRPVQRLDGAVPYLEINPTNAGFGVPAGTASPATGSHVIRWSSTGNAAGTFGVLFRRTNELLCTHAGAAFNTSGSNVMLSLNSTVYISLGAMANGRHDYEVRVDSVGQSVQLFVDGVSRGPVAFTGNIGTISDELKLGFETNAFSPNDNIYGFGLFDGAGTDAQMQHWIAMSQLAWGAHS